MDDSSTCQGNKPPPRIPLGMSSFGQSEREEFGRNVRLAMACIEGEPQPVKGPALPQDEPAIRQRLLVLSQEISSQHADLLELLVRFDDLLGWKSTSASHCAAWMNLELGISLQLGWEYLRVGRRLQTLPTLQALFRAGTLSWSKVRVITRVADNDNEKILCHAALDASVSDVERLCQAYRWCEDDNAEGGDEGKKARALQQWDSRALTWCEASNGSTRIQLVLPPELAQAFLNSVEYSLNQLGEQNSHQPGETVNTMSQKRADAAVLMAEASLQHAGRAIATADRYQVNVSVDADELSSVHSDNQSRRAILNGAGPIAKETARRIACDCTVSVTHANNGEPVNIGRKSRIWPGAMARVIRERDQHCAWPGCTHSNHLHIHHIKHWADGGETSVHNGVCLCAYHHTLVHEGGYTIEHVDGNHQRQHEQFKQQQQSDIGMFDFERDLRNDKASFNNIRKLSPTRYRYRILDAQGRNISIRSTSGYENINGDNDASHSANQVSESTSVYSVENQHEAEVRSTNDIQNDCSQSANQVGESTRVYSVEHQHAAETDSTRVGRNNRDPSQFCRRRTNTALWREGLSSSL